MPDAKENEWYKKFQEGTFVIKGWKARTNEILKKIPYDEREDLKGKLELLGDKIGREWARDNSVRRIDNTMLQTWGNDLLAVTEGGGSALMEKIDSVESEVDRLLA
ncbi:MAG: hypothetical protein HQK66_10090 [Desulfamplus sp.]|nr:hypothetical protein [Desulfamplus sp.]